MQGLRRYNLYYLCFKMETGVNKNVQILPHHEQQPLCTSRLPYRQGRKLTAVKVYSIINESNHLLIFGVPSLNLRSETKNLFIKFGKLKHFNISKCHPSEDFTDTYHASYDNVNSARMAKKFLDGKNFYGSSLHVTYAPEFETVDEAREKLLDRQKNVIGRLKNLQKDTTASGDKALKEIDNEGMNINFNSKEQSIENNKILDLLKEKSFVENKKLNMGKVNIININNCKTKKRKFTKINSNVVIEKKFKPCFVNDTNNDSKSSDVCKDNDVGLQKRLADDNIEIVNCTSIETEVVTNINEHLNYNKFGNEIIKPVQRKAVNKINFIIKNKTLL